MEKSTISIPAEIEKPVTLFPLNDAETLYGVVSKVPPRPAKIKGFKEGETYCAAVITLNGNILARYYFSDADDAEAAIWFSVEASKVLAQD